MPPPPGGCGGCAPPPPATICAPTLALPAKTSLPLPPSGLLPDPRTVGSGAVAPVGSRFGYPSLELGTHMSTCSNGTRLCSM